MRKRRSVDVRSFQPAIEQSIVDNETQVETIHNPYPSHVIDTVSPTDALRIIVLTTT